MCPRLQPYLPEGECCWAPKTRRPSRRCAYMYIHHMYMWQRSSYKVGGNFYRCVHTASAAGLRLLHSHRLLDRHSPCTMLQCTMYTPADRVHARLGWIPTSTLCAEPVTLYIHWTPTTLA